MKMSTVIRFGKCHVYFLEKHFFADLKFILWTQTVIQSTLGYTTIFSVDGVCSVVLEILEMLAMTTEQAPYPEKDHEMSLKSPEKASKWTFS